MQEDQYIHKTKAKQVNKQTPTRALTPLKQAALLVIAMLCIFVIWRFTARSDPWHMMGVLTVIYLLIKVVSVLFTMSYKHENSKKEGDSISP